MGEIVLAQVRKSYDGKQFAVEEVTYTIQQGHFVTLLGPSGCGKTTTLNMIAGLEDITGGSITIDGCRVDELSPDKRDLAFVFQDYALYPHMTVFGNIAFGLEIAGFSKPDIAQRVKAASDILNLTDYLDRKPGQLSGGQRQRVAIGRAIAREPKVFLFDEPLSNLDAALRVQMRIEISRLHQQLKATMIYVTHDQVEAMTMADRIVVLNKGRIEQVGTPSELYNSPRNAFVAGFIGSPKMNFLRGSVAEALGGATIGIRPEHVALSLDRGDWAGTVQLSENLGSDTYVYADTEHGPMTVRAVGEHSFPVGGKVYLSPMAGRVHAFDADGLSVRASALVA